MGGWGDEVREEWEDGRMGEGDDGRIGLLEQTTEASSKW